MSSNSIWKPSHTLINTVYKPIRSFTQCYAKSNFIRISKASQELRDAIIAERTEKIKEFLKKDIVEDDDALVETPVQKNIASNPSIASEVK